MRNEDKLIDAVIDLGTGLKELREEVKGMRKDLNQRIDGLATRVDGLTTRTEKLEINQAKTNHLLSENTRALLKLAERQDNTINELKELRMNFNNYAFSNDKIVLNHEKRIVHLENPGKGKNKMLLVKEPKQQYRTRKK